MLHSSKTAIADLFLSSRKFFGNPNGTKAPAAQSKLSFLSKRENAAPMADADAAEESEDVVMKENELDTEAEPKAEVKPMNQVMPKKEVESKTEDVKEESPELKENVKPAKGRCFLLSCAPYNSAN